jgi:hypothetical protein
MADKEWISIQEAMDLLHRSRGAVWRWAKDKLKPQKLAKLVDVGTKRSPQKMWLIHRSAIDARLRRATVVNTPPPSPEQIHIVEKIVQRIIDLKHPSTDEAFDVIQKAIRNEPAPTDHRGKDAAIKLQLVAALYAIKQFLSVAHGGAQ